MPKNSANNPKQSLKLKLNPRPIISTKTALFQGIISQNKRKLQAMHSNFSTYTFYAYFTLSFPNKNSHLLAKQETNH